MSIDATCAPGMGLRVSRPTHISNASAKRSSSRRDAQVTSSADGGGRCVEVVGGDGARGDPPRGDAPAEVAARPMGEPGGGGSGNAARRGGRGAASSSIGLSDDRTPLLDTATNRSISGVDVFSSTAEAPPDEGADERRVRAVARVPTDVQPPGVQVGIRDDDEDDAVVGGPISSVASRAFAFSGATPDGGAAEGDCVLGASLARNDN